MGALHVEAIKDGGGGSGIDGDGDCDGGGGISSSNVTSPAANGHAFT